MGVGRFGDSISGTAVRGAEEPDMEANIDWDMVGVSEDRLADKDVFRRVDGSGAVRLTSSTSSI